MTTVIVGTNQTSAWPHFGGSSWVRLQYLLGLERLGIDAYWVDRLAPPDPAENPHRVQYLVQRFQRMAEDFGFADRYCIVYNRGERYFGMDAPGLDRVVERAELLINISGRLEHGDPLHGVRRRAFIDVDPGFTQIWAHQADMHFDRHDVFFTTGQNVGGPGFGVPTNGIEWKPTFPPVVLERWPALIDERAERIGTVADWRGSQVTDYNGHWYLGKREEFLGFVRVPEEAKRKIDLALLVGQDDYEDLGTLMRHGWRVHDPYSHAGDPHSYQEFIQSSRAEFSVAKQGYVRTLSGWVSDRTACYMASGKPAVVQSTGFERRLPVGTGLLSFTTVQNAVEALREIDSDYLRHARAAREIAEEYFDSDVVLRSLLQRSGL
jgi:hypothetical protein